MAAEEVFDLETDRIDEESEKETQDWVEEEMRKEKEVVDNAQKDQKVNDEQWMVDQLKKEFGDDFGEDIDADFSE